MNANANILIVDDEPDMVSLMADALGARGYACEVAHDGVGALNRVDKEDVDLVLTDLNMPRTNGIALTEAVKERSPEVPVLIMTAFGSITSAVEAMKAGAYDFLTKPLDMNALFIAVERALEHRALKLEVDRLRKAVRAGDGFGGFVGQSRPMRELYETLVRVATVDSSVLLLGETGTGKELAARALHDASPRSDGPFVSVNLSAIPESLLESQFFGHEKGAFTDARTRYEGLLLAAHGGTLFLDEIGDMPAALQPKLLRALQERKVRPVGGTEEVPFDARIVAATHQDLGQAVAEGRFREDLYYRLNVISVELPPLREREEDVLRLARFFVEKVSARMDRPTPSLSPGALSLLRAYAWPGNVRELENAMERAVALCRNDEVRETDLPPALRKTTSAERVEPAGDEVELVSLDEIERRHIMRVLEALEGNKLQAAKVLGLDRRTLYRRLERYDAAA
jgi:two-component system response regulator AtoC